MSEGRTGRSYRETSLLIKKDKNTSEGEKEEELERERCKK